MTDFLDQLEADLRVAAERRGEPRRRRPTGALKLVAALAVLALLAVGAMRVIDRDATGGVAAEPTPTPTPAFPLDPRQASTTAVATSGEPALLGVLSAKEGGFVALSPDPDGQPRTADPSLGTVVLYRPPAKQQAQFMALDEKIDRVEPLTPAAEARLHFDVSKLNVVVVYGPERVEAMLRDPKICAPAGDADGGPLKLCVSRSDEQRFSTFVVADRPLSVEPISARGWWSWAAASPGGGTILAQWSSRCKVPRSALISSAGGRPLVVPIGAAIPLGWTTDGHALAYRPPNAGCGDGAAPGLYQVTTDGRATLIAPANGSTPPLPQSLTPRDESP
jgi:hypothetical protein